MRMLNFLEIRGLLKRQGLNLTLLQLDTLLRKHDISKQQHRVMQNWIVTIHKER